MMVDDGVNDASALVLLTNDLRSLPAAIDLSRRTLRVVHQNLFWAFAYNAVGIAIAAAGVLNPSLAAGAMVVSSLSVILNSMRASRAL